MHGIEYLRSKITVINYTDKKQLRCNRFSRGAPLDQVGCNTAPPESSNIAKINRRVNRVLFFCKVSNLNHGSFIDKGYSVILKTPSF